MAAEAWAWADEKAHSAGEMVLGHGKSVLIAIVNLLPLKPDSPYSVALLKHYVEGSGDPYQLTDIPVEWQDWIAKATRGTPGVHRGLNPYNSGIYDLRNSLGHFDVKVAIGRDKTTTYEIRDVYQFGFTKNDSAQRGRHGFPVGELDESTIKFIRRLLPSAEYQNPGGFKEHWEIKKLGKESFLLIPQQFLAEQGKTFEVNGSFTR